MSNDTVAGCPPRDPRFPAVWPSHIIPVNSTLFSLTVVYVLCGAALLVHHRKKPFVFERGYSVQLLAGLSILFEAIIVFLRDAIGRDLFPCDAYLWLSSLTAPIFCASVWIRLIIYHNKTTLAGRKAEANLELLNTNIIEHKRLRELQGETSKSSSRFGDSARKILEIVNPKPIIFAAAANMRQGMARHGSVQIIKVNDLLLAKALTGEGFAFLIMVAIMVPFLVVIGYRYEVVPYYGHGCVGCILGSQETWIFAGAIIGIALLGVVAVVYWRLYKDPDPLWILHELFWVSFVAALFTIPALILDSQNAGNIYTDGIISWGYLISFGMSIGFGIQTYWVVYHSYKLDRRRQDSISSSRSSINVNITFDEIMSTPSLKKIFAEHLISEFSIENLKFYDQVAAWEKAFPTATSKQRSTGAEAIYRTFLDPNKAPLEVNVSAIQREPLTQVFNQPIEERNINSSLFEVTKREVFKLMSLDSFNRFKTTGAYLSMAPAVRDIAPTDSNTNLSV